MWYVYVLWLGNGRYYVGCTVDVKGRVTQHKGTSLCSSALISTSDCIEYVGCIEFASKRDALNTEKLLQQTENAGQIRQAIEKLGSLFNTAWPPPKRSIYNAALPRYSVWQPVPDAKGRRDQRVQELNGVASNE